MTKNSDPIVWHGSSSKVEDREARKARYYEELFAKLEKEQKFKEVKDEKVEPAVVEKSEAAVLEQPPTRGVGRPRKILESNPGKSTKPSSTVSPVKRSLIRELSSLGTVEDSDDSDDERAQRLKKRRQGKPEDEEEAKGSINRDAKSSASYKRTRKYLEISARRKIPKPTPINNQQSPVEPPIPAVKGKPGRKPASYYLQLETIEKPKDPESKAKRKVAAAWKEMVGVRIEPHEEEIAAKTQGFLPDPDFTFLDKPGRKVPWWKKRVKLAASESPDLPPAVSAFLTRKPFAEFPGVVSKQKLSEDGLLAVPYYSATPSSVANLPRPVDSSKLRLAPREWAKKLVNMFRVEE